MQVVVEAAALVFGLGVALGAARLLLAGILAFAFRRARS